MFAPEKTRFRKCFTEILQLEDAVMEGKKLAKEDGPKAEESKLLGKRRTLDAAPTTEARRKKEESINKIIDKEVEYF
jgi:hypothetical protein